LRPATSDVRSHRPGEGIILQGIVTASGTPYFSEEVNYFDKRIGTWSFTQDISKKEATCFQNNVFSSLAKQKVIGDTGHFSLDVCGLSNGPTETQPTISSHNFDKPSLNKTSTTNKKLLPVQ
jgi:hypothetical protein